MTDMVNIEVQTDNGNWIRVYTCANISTVIRKNLINSIQSGPGSRTKKSRATAMNNGMLIDIYQG